jgi:hypothetical protein
VAQYVPDGSDALDRLVQSLVELFGTAERELVQLVAMQLRTGLEDGERNAARALRMGELTRDAQTIARRLAEAYPGELDRILAVASEWGADAALQELSDLADVPDITAATAALPGAAAAQVVRADLSNALEDVTRRVLRFPDDVYRRAVALDSTTVLLGTGTTQTAQAAAWNRLLDGGVTGFVDKSGRRWTLSAYTEMATRSATRRAYNDAHVGALRQAGIDLVSVVVGRGSCEPCARWAGKVLRTDNGPTGRIRVQHATEDREVTVTVAGTLDEAKAHKWRHPNCRCRTVAYLPGLSVIADVTTYDPDAEKARQQLRYLERQVRKAKSEAAAALDDDQRRTADRKVRDLQARIREHVAEHDLMRQRNREQPDLGHIRRTR